VPGTQKRLGELDATMAADAFWNNRDTAQKLIDEATLLRRKVDPLLSAEKRLDDFRVMLELGEAEPPSQQKLCSANWNATWLASRKNSTRSNSRFC
jgi:hypothetical protein